MTMDKRTDNFNNASSVEILVADALKFFISEFQRVRNRPSSVKNLKSPARCLGRMIKLLKIENNSSKWFVVCVNLICMRAGRRILLLSCDPSLPEKAADGLTRWGPRLLRPSYLGVCELCVMSKGQNLEMGGPLSLSRPTVCGELVTVGDDMQASLCKRPFGRRAATSIRTLRRTPPALPTVSHLQP